MEIKIKDLLTSGSRDITISIKRTDQVQPVKLPVEVYVDGIRVGATKLEMDEFDRVFQNFDEIFSDFNTQKSEA